MYVQTSSVWAGCDTRSIFKRSLTGLNSEFSFSLFFIKYAMISNYTFWQIYKSTQVHWLPYVCTNPSVWAGCDTRSIFKRSLTGLNSEFSFSSTSCLTKAEEPSLPYCLPIAGGRIIGFIPFPRVLVLCEIQLFSTRIWTRVAVSISKDGNHYTTGTSIIKS